MTKFTHAKLWRAIDRTAEAHGLSASGLASRDMGQMPGCTPHGECRSALGARRRQALG